MTKTHIENKIKRARISAMISGVITGAGAVAHMLNRMNSQISLFQMLSLVDAVIIFSMAHGIHKKSRIYAVLMFEYFLLSKLFILSTLEQISPGALILGTAFLYFLYEGITGTFAYHKCNACREETVSPTPYAWICAGSCGLILYVFVLPTMFI